MKTIVLVVCLAGFLPIVSVRQRRRSGSPPPRPKATSAKPSWCVGTAVDTRISRYAIGDRGKPVQVDLDQPEPNPIFNFVTFAPDTHKPQEVRGYVQGKASLRDR